jgi:hypothetical protein
MRFIENENKTRTNISIERNQWRCTRLVLKQINGDKMYKKYVCVSH